MPLRQRFETLLLFDPNRSPATANVWISHPSPSEEQALGKLVVVSSLGGLDRVNQDIIGLIQEELKTNYYQAVDALPAKAFEHALHQTNKRLSQVITDGVGTWVDRASILVAAVWRETMIISSVGTIHGYLLRRSVRDGRPVFQMHDLIGSDVGAPNPVRLFAHTISGQLQADDQVLICTPSLLDYFSLEKLRRTLIDGQPDEAIHHWETTLLGVEQRSAFAAVVIQSLSLDSVTVAANRPVPQATLVHSAPQVSMSQLIAKEQATERLLSPSIWPAVREMFVLLSQGLGRLIRRVILRKPPRRVISSGLQKPPTPLSTKSSAWLGVRRAISIGLSSIINFVKILLPRRPDLQKTTSKINMPPVQKKRQWPSLNSLVIWFQSLSRQQQGLMAASLLLIVILAVAILPRTKQATKTTVTTTTGSSISDDLAKAKAAILYGGDDSALQYLNDARALADKLPNKSAKDKAAKQTALENIAVVATQLAKLTTIPKPTIVAQLATTAPTAKPQQLYLSGNHIIGVDPTHSIVISTTIGTTATSAVIPNALDTGAPVAGVVSGTSNVIFSTDRRGFIELDASKGTWKPLDSAWPTTSSAVHNIAFYQNRVYALDTANNSIVRFARAANSLGTGVNWLKETAILTNARGIAVDGTIYVLQPKAIIEAYANGRKSSFTLATIDPKLTDATKMWTDANSKNLYLVDPSKKRILVFSKTGKLLNQYTSPTWDNLQDVTVNEKTKTAYVLNGTTIYSFTLLQ